ncbi:MAG: heme-degrading monooxygenase HmoA [Saprospiraceae bacterium]|jgi:autoinducer 2-degrading protein|tara:strand:- start:100 stop:396 length:297 start_codon:yes stop_codon:yes gene_type:complete
MIKRIVKMTFQADKIEIFKVLFDERKEKIRGFEGCEYLELLQDKNHPNILFTYSFWNSENDLNIYRHSELFKDTWRHTKALFDGKPEAWSVDSVVQLP